MKITINKNQQAINFKKHVYQIIGIAKYKAKNGIERFYYPTPRNQGIDTTQLINAVEKKTEQSVYGGYGCIKDGQIRFSIE